MTTVATRTIGVLLILASGALAACASGGGGRSYTRLLITPADIAGTGYETAYEVLTHHRELIILEDQIQFRGGDDRSGTGRSAQTYTRPLLVLDGDQNLNDPITTLRQIPAGEIASIRLWRASMVPPEYRRPGAENGVIAIQTR